MIDRSKFEAEDFLVDATFQHYCAGTDELSIGYWKKYITNHPEQHAVIAEAEKIYHIISGTKGKLNERVLAFRQSFKPAKAKRPKIHQLWWAAAASLVIMLGVGLYFFRDTKKEATFFATSYTTKVGERKRITLPDGSIVWLNAKSNLMLDKAFNKGNREVLLKGEAFFDVKHSKTPFRVHTDQFAVNVLGTAFNVKAYAEEPIAEATLIRGLITMQPVDGTGIITLKPSQKVTVYKKTTKNTALPRAKRRGIEPKHPEIAIDHYQLLSDSSVVETAWTQNRLEIYDQDFSEVKSVLERWYNIRISFNGLEVEKYRFTATFNNENIKQVLEALQQVEKFNYEIKGDQITISK